MSNISHNCNSICNCLQGKYHRFAVTSQIFFYIFSTFIHTNVKRKAWVSSKLSVSASCNVQQIICDPLRVVTQVHKIHKAMSCNLILAKPDECFKIDRKKVGYLLEHTYIYITLEWCIGIFLFVLLAWPV